MIWQNCFFLCDMPIDILEFNDQQELTKKQQKYILLNLIKLCKKNKFKTNILLFK